MRTRFGLLALVTVGLCAGCGASRQAAYLETGGRLKSATVQPVAAGARASVAKAWEEAETAWSRRDDAGWLRASLAKHKEVVKLKPDHRGAMVRLARGYYLLGYGHAATDAERMASYDEGARWGERMMALNPAFRARIKAGASVEQALSTCTKQDVPGIYWAYANLGKWSVMQGFTTVLKNKDKVKAFIDRVAALDEAYYYGAAHRGLFAFYAKALSFAGGDLARAKRHYDASIKIAPGYLGTKVLLARYYATKKQDRTLFKQLLQEVIDGDANAIPEVVPIQKIEQRKARELLAEIDELFE